GRTVTASERVRRVPRAWVVLRGATPASASTPEYDPDARTPGADAEAPVVQPADREFAVVRGTASWVGRRRGRE
ncbi:MAG: hypothetical protein ACRDLP_10205, partial [Solirubrobacteraceae bacterium]